MRHQKNYDHSYLVCERKEIQQLRGCIKHRVEDPICSPDRKLGVVGLVAAKLSQVEKCLIGWVQQVTEQIQDSQ